MVPAIYMYPVLCTHDLLIRVVIHVLVCGEGCGFRQLNCFLHTIYVPEQVTRVNVPFCFAQTYVAFFLNVTLMWRFIV